MAPSTLRKVESGETGLRADHAVALARVFGVHPGDLFPPVLPGDYGPRVAAALFRIFGEARLPPAEVRRILEHPAFPAAQHLVLQRLDMGNERDFREWVYAETGVYPGTWEAGS